MVSKSLIYRKIYENIEKSGDLPKIEIDQIAQILIESPKGIPNCENYELTSHAVNFRNVLEGTRRDLTLHYSIKGVKLVYKDPLEFEGIKYYDTFSHEESENTILKVDYVSFFTKPKENINEHRIYQIGPHYSNKEEIILEALIRRYEKEGDITSTINTIKKLLIVKPNDPKRWTRLGELLVNTEQYDNAIEAGKKAIELVGMFTPAWICLGMAYYGKGDTEKAKRFIKKTLDDDPSYLKALGSMAQIHFNEKEYEKALEYCNQHLEYDFSDNKRDSKEIFKLREKTNQKLGIQEEFSKEISENQEHKEALIRLTQRLKDDNKEYVDYLEHFNMEDLKPDANGKIVDEKELAFCKEAIIIFFDNGFMKAFVDANRYKEYFRTFINDVFPKLVSNVEIFYGSDVLLNLITSIISNTKDTAYIYIPIPFREVLSYVSEWAYENEDKKIVFYAFWEDELSNKNFSKMNKFGNIQVRRLAYPYSFFVAMRDEKELILTPFNLDLLSIKSKDGEFINFYKTILIPILNGASKPINFEELKVIDSINKFLDDLL